jgi:hypothetical protein
MGREKRPPKGRQINSEISSTLEKYDVNWKVSFAGECSGRAMATHFIHSPGDEGTRTRGHESGTGGDSVSSPNDCGKGAIVGSTSLS